MATQAASDLSGLEDRYRAKAARLRETAGINGGRQAPVELAGEALESFLRRYYWQAPVDDVLDRQPADLYDVAVAHYELSRHRAEGTAVVRAGTLSEDESQTLGTRTVIQIVNEDMPFLVDSVTAALNQRGCRLHHVVHPVLVVRRDITGALLEVCDTSDPGRCPRDGVVESWMHIEIDREPDPDNLRAIEGDLRRVLNDVREAVEDWGKMRATSVRIARELENSWLDLPAAELAEAAELLRWLADDHFTFLGFREYTLERDEDGQDALRAVPASGLGILRADSDMANTFRRLPPVARDKARDRTVLILTKADSRSSVHRPVYLDYIGIKSFDASGEVVGERRFLGLFSSSAYTESVTSVPVLRRKVSEVLQRAHLPKSSHSGKDLLDILENYPRDELFQVTAGELLPVVMAVLHLGERRQTRLFLRRDGYGRFFSALVYLPRDRYTTAVRVRMQDILVEALGGTSVEYTARSTESVLARLHFVVRVPKGAELSTVDVSELQDRLTQAARSWGDDLADALVRRHGANQASTLTSRYERAFSEGYKQDFPAEDAVEDLEQLERLSGDELGMKLYIPEADDPVDGEARFKIYRTGRPLLLSDVLPVLQHMGVSVIDERPYDITRPDCARAWIYDFGLRGASSTVEASYEEQAELFQDAFAAVWRGDAEDDGLNALVLLGGLTWRQVAIVRAYVRYLRQGGLTFSPDYVEACLAGHAPIAALLVALFEARFDPASGGDRAGDCERIVERIGAALADVASLDEDRILSALLAVIQVTLRTNYYQRTADGAVKSYLSVKLDPTKVPDLPEPRPAREIWVYSPRLEGVHLRFGAVARGGLRWSDRHQDFRTEVLGLVKAQTVKNTVIVPTGAKGGFVVKRPGDPASREAVQAEGVACYRTFISGLLDLTDNLEVTAGGGSQTVPPPDVVRHDGDDSYLVVAADKGTATFSDIANEVAESYGFWLGDAFASGGSVGYDHKAMGITARGAWESVARHFRELGPDTQAQDFTVVGVGDMSGDVFGNGMLLSQHIRLVAAFDHRDIFLDPDPESAASYVERRRLFELPRSSWADYDPALISAGGGVHSRAAKRIPVTPEVRRALGLAEDVEALSPPELMRAILAAPVDLFWNGGIGTYVKASAENNADVGDKANDAIRVSGAELRVRVVGEGGNLGCTQLGRIEFALAGGKINTDAIDNSAGVDTSDHEVNIKILLGRAEREGLLDRDGRNALLAEMTDEVAELVLRDNYDQNAALACEATYALSLLDVHQRYIRRLVRDGLLNRAIEYLPNDRALAERQREGIGLTQPEFAVLLAYTKIVLTADILGSDLPDDPAVRGELYRYFPRQLRERFAAQMDAHPLRREIITTQIVNTLVNTAGITGAFRLREESGESTEAITRGHLVAHEVFDVGGVWEDAEALDNVVPAEVQTFIRLEACRLAERATRWLLLHSDPPLDIAAAIDRFRSGVGSVIEALPDRIRGIDAEASAERLAELESAGVPTALARQVATYPKAISALDVVRAAAHTGRSTSEVAEVYFYLDDRLALAPLLERIIALPRAERWQAMARAALRDDLNAEHAALTVDVLRSGEPQDPPDQRFERWHEQATSAQERALGMLAEISAGDSLDLATLVVAIRTIRGMLRGPADRAPA
ncbi:NAD-glutamate dehydrogenase [soil metagenome]